MKIIVTAGGTSEYIDEVRVLTNISSGKLGAIISDYLDSKGHEIAHVMGRGSVVPDDINDRMTIDVVKGVDELVAYLEPMVKDADVIIHAMAVSDFGFDRSKPVKLKSNDPQAFIDYMRDTIKINPKVISMIKKWNPNIKLVGFKFEVGKDVDDLFELALASIERNGCDLVIANDKEEMKREGTHVAYFVDSDERTPTQVRGKDEIAEMLGQWVDVL